MAKKTRATKAFMVAAKMPPLRHSINGESFDLAKSEVVAWLLQQPEIQQANFEYYRGRKAIVFKDGRWVGSDYEK